MIIYQLTKVHVRFLDASLFNLVPKPQWRLALEVQNLRRSTASVSHCPGLGMSLVLLLLPELLGGSRCIMASTKPLIKSCIHDIMAVVQYHTGY